MRRLFGAAGLAVLVTSVSFGAATPAMTGGAHDFIDGTANDGWVAAGEDQMCIFCHTPHAAKTGTDQLIPLWNHTSTTPGAFTEYSSPTLTPGQSSVGSDLTKACMSCHDGSVALDSYVGGSGDTTVITGISAALEVDGDFSNDHPVGMIYETSAAAEGVTGLVDSATVFGAGLLRGTLATTATVECSSCHDVHGSDAVGGKLLRISMVNSELCITCHVK